MLRFSKADTMWWRKPLVAIGGRVIPAELAVLAEETRTMEQGAWLNSRGRASGVVDLVPLHGKNGRTYRTLRAPLPLFVATGLEGIYHGAQIAKGCPDLVIWRSDQESFRLVEVKCPHWDTPGADQERFIAEARRRGIDTRVVEWEFRIERGLTTA